MSSSYSQKSAENTVDDAAQQKTVGQLERQISQKVQAFYRVQLGHQPSKVTCQLFDTKLAIILDDSVTRPEQLLADEGQTELAEQVRTDLSKALRPQLIELIEEILSTKVLDLMSDATLETRRTGIIAVLERIPDVRNPTAIPKVKRGQSERPTEEPEDK